MEMGIIVCGLNGAGKSTLGKALAERLGFYFLDNEQLFFPNRGPNEAYCSPRSQEEVEALLLQELKSHKDFVFAAVKGEYGEAVLPFFRLAVLIRAPREVRLRRLRERSFQRFGARMLPGGDLHQQEESFFRMAAARPEGMVENWLRTLRCPAIAVDGTKPVQENVGYLASQIPFARQAGGHTPISC